jgi:hypothetical protein
LARILDCARLTIVGLEGGRLRMSPNMAERISLHCGVSRAWLLKGNPRLVPVCEQDPQRPFNKEVFDMTRAEVLDPRIEPADLAVIGGAMERFCAQLRGIARAAYGRDQITYFNYKTREFLEGLELRWKVPNKFGLSEAEFKHLLEKDSLAKKTSNTIVNKRGSRK